jgi:hypothetical protein
MDQHASPTAANSEERLLKHDWRADITCILHLRQRRSAAFVTDVVFRVFSTEIKSSEKSI